jgi:hypothetical protein
MSRDSLPYCLPVRVVGNRPVYPETVYFRAPDSSYLVGADGLSARDMAILHSVYACRLMTAGQLERLHFADNRSSDTAARISRRVLKRLAEQDILRRRERRIGGIRAGSAGFIYSLGAQGARLLSDKRLHYYVHDPSDYFMQHTLALAELYVVLHEQSRSDSYELLEIQTEPTCWRVFITLANGKQTLKPDMFVKLGVGDDELSYFVELDRGTTYAGSLLKKLRTYERYFQVGKEQREGGVFPQVLWLVPDRKRQTALEWLCAPLNARIPGLCMVTTQEDLLQVITGAKPP